MAEFERFFKIEIENKSDGTVYRNYEIVDEGIIIPADMGIAENSMNLNEILFSGDLRFGEYTSNKFEVKLFGLSDGVAGPMPDVTGFTITVTDWGTADSEELKNHIFEGTIESATTDDKNGYRNIVAYDDMHKYKDTDIGKDWELFWNESEGEHKTHTLKEIREAVCSFVGIQLAPDQRDFPNDSVVFCYRNYQPGEILAPNASSIKFSDLLSAICEIQCICPNMNRSGQLEFISLTNGIKQTDYTEDYAKNDTTFEDYAILKPTGFDVYANSTTHLLKYPNDESNSNPYIISGNIFLVTATADQAIELLTNMQPEILNISYTPANISMIISDLSGNLGDTVQISVDNNGAVTTTTHCIMTQTLSGPLLVDQTIECRASGPNLSTSVPSINDSVVQDLTAKEYNTRLGDLETKVSTMVTKDSVEIEINKIKNEISENGVSKVTTAGKKYTFDDSGLDISDPNDEISTKVTNDGFRVLKDGVDEEKQTMLKANNQGVDAQNLHATSYLIISNECRFEKYKEDRIGCFMLR